MWTDDGKVAAIGVRVSRGVSMHGFALNVDPDLGYFGHMHPCGISDRPVTSLSSLCGRRVSLEEVIDLVVPRFAEAFGYERREVQLAPSPGDRVAIADSRWIDFSLPAPSHRSGGRRSRY